MRDAPFVHLDVRSCFSLKEGAFTPEQLARRAAELGMPRRRADRPRRALRRRAVRAGVRATRACAPILGASVTVRAPSAAGRAGAEGTPTWCCSRSTTPGYANLCRLLTDAHMLGERGDPWVDPEQICAHAGGPRRDRSDPGRTRAALAVAGRVDAAARLLDPFREAFGPERLFVGVEHRLERGSDDEVRAMLRLAERAGVARRRHEPGALPRARATRSWPTRSSACGEIVPIADDQRHPRATPRAG